MLWDVTLFWGKGEGKGKEERDEMRVLLIQTNWANLGVSLGCYCA